MPKTTVYKCENCGKKTEMDGDTPPWLWFIVRRAAGGGMDDGPCYFCTIACMCTWWPKMAAEDPEGYAESPYAPKRAEAQ